MKGSKTLVTSALSVEPFFQNQAVLWTVVVTARIVAVSITILKHVFAEDLDSSKIVVKGSEVKRVESLLAHVNLGDVHEPRPSKVGGTSRLPNAFLYFVMLVELGQALQNLLKGARVLVFYVLEQQLLILLDLEQAQLHFFKGVFLLQHDQAKRLLLH